MFIRPYEPKDRDQILAIAREQGLKVDVPLPDSDTSVISALVGVEGEHVVLAIVGRLSIEAHCIVRPNEPNGARKIKRAMETSEGFIYAVSERMKTCGFPGVADLQAFVPSWMRKFRATMERFLGWVEEPQGYTVYYKRLGSGVESATSDATKDEV